LREEVDILSTGIEDKDYELYGLNGENSKLREKIGVLETIIKSYVKDSSIQEEIEEAVKLRKLQTHENQTSELHARNRPIDKVYHELIHLR
jgi:hypothetical protein